MLNFFLLLFCYQIKFKGEPKVGNNMCGLMVGWKIITSFKHLKYNANCYISSSIFCSWIYSRSSSLILLQYLKVITTMLIIISKFLFIFVLTLISFFTFVHEWLLLGHQEKIWGIKLHDMFLIYTLWINIPIWLNKIYFIFFLRFFG